MNPEKNEVLNPVIPETVKVPVVEKKELKVKEPKVAKEPKVKAVKAPKAPKATCKAVCGEKALAILKEKGPMSLNAIAAVLKYYKPNLKAKIYFGLKDLAEEGKVKYGEKKGKEKLFAVA